MRLSNILFCGDSLNILRSAYSDSFDSLVTDPPAGISFMGKDWDRGENFIARMSEIYAEALRVLKPGAYGLVWALPRTSHWTAMALEQAGFSIRDIVHHINGAGFPKSHNVEKSLTKLGETEAAEKFKGYGSALKPAVENWILVRKQLSEKNLALNTLRWGCGGLNIDASRVGYQSESDKGSATPQGVCTSQGLVGNNGKDRNEFSRPELKGRFPAHLILSHQNTVYYALKDGINPQLKLAIEEFYGYPEMSELSPNLRDDAVFSKERKEVLQHPLQSSNEQEDLYPQEKRDGLRAMQEDVSCLELQDKGRQRGLLFEGLQEQIRGNHSGDRSPTLRQAAPTSNAMENISQPERSENGEKRQMEGRADDISARVRLHNDRPATDRNGGIGRENERGQLCVGASRGDGNEVGAPSREDRISAPHQRSEIGQSGGEFSDSRPVETFEGTQASGETLCNSGSRERVLAVPIDQIPSQWLKYFNYSHSQDCVELGTREVKPQGGAQAGSRIKTRNLGFGEVKGKRDYALDLYGANGSETVANFACVEGCPIQELDRQSGNLNSAGLYKNIERSSKTPNSGRGMFAGGVKENNYANQTGGASRFFYCSKASKRDRNAGLEGMGETTYRLKNGITDDIIRRIEAVING